MGWRRWEGKRKEVGEGEEEEGCRGRRRRVEVGGGVEEVGR